ncbi:MAG: hypothetical protein U0997_13665 [Sulfurimicrobium sp.]|nr:hypothetical protein [Sulfurimicrobium sp.]
MKTPLKYVMENQLLGWCFLRGGILKKEMIVAKQMTLMLERFVVCSTGEEMEIPEPADSLEAAIKLRDEKQAGDAFEIWEIVAEVDA